MDLQELDLETMLAEIGRATPSISGSTAALVAAQLGTAMVRMALAVSHNHGSDTDLLIERLDSILSEIKDATEKDRAASSALIDAYRQNAESSASSAALTDATREPLAAAHLLIELLEVLKDASGKVENNVASDFYGGIELINAAFKAVTMAVESNLHQEGAGELRARTSYNRSDLFARADLAMKNLESLSTSLPNKVND
ncbi:cyclodeaminase/cyclohydrolase family protein [Neorhizobium galegae]|uniref:cyclodeaminase/cyclohydrolase family protein n=1 Tax=Neorhizobium galegae TaxID=399 RepID=UPI0021055DA9|nr:cyclodeaminase/cyclohydrolase family protein [Neorhizobium galegae]MCQ1781571.1 cyclodeaminase/cyclohydrolase family protein [Neorhizobium galegae]MCQ1799043.1 cyclodeaminase/cyclohydrolase family protein [Neorhizobium galegae]